MIAQDPTELFDVLRADGTPTGRAKPRADVHRDGDWHRALHVWIAGIEADELFLLVQRRGPDKDIWPGWLDVTVGGHFGAGEGLTEVLREVEEEIGLVPDPGRLRYLGTRVAISESEPGIRDHELQEVYLLRDDRPLITYRPNPVELAALVRLPLTPLLDLLAGHRETLTGLAIEPAATEAVPCELRRADFLPTVDAYWYRVAIAAALALRGGVRAGIVGIRRPARRSPTPG